MTEPRQLPSFDISIRDYEDDDTGRTIFHPVIRANTSGYSLGVLALTHFDDLFLVREAINRFIIINNINNPYPMKEEKEEAQAPQYAAMIGGYLTTEGWRPMTRGNFNPKGMAVRSSQEIIIDLADMVDLTLNDVAACMLHLGYTTISVEGKVGWLLGQRSGEDPTSE